MIFLKLCIICIIRKCTQLLELWFIFLKDSVKYPFIGKETTYKIPFLSHWIFLKRWKYKLWIPKESIDLSYLNQLMCYKYTNEENLLWFSAVLTEFPYCTFEFSQNFFFAVVWDVTPKCKICKCFVEISFELKD
jgi:hypothetical protein